MREPAKSLPLFLLAAAVLIAASVLLALLLLHGTMETWQHGELLLKRGRVVPRQISLQDNGLEFFLRVVVFPGSLALSTISFAAIVAMVVGHRIFRRQAVADSGTYVWPRFAVRACLLPLGFFLIWMLVLIVVPLTFR